MRRVLSLLALAAVAQSCKEPTQIVIEAHTNVAREADVVTAFTVGSPGQTEKADPKTETSGPRSGSLIGTLVVVPGTADDAALAVKIVMGVSRGARECVAPDYKGCIVARRRLRYVPNERLRLPITLYAHCEDVPCDELSTCSVLGKCVPVEPVCVDGTCALPGEIGVDGNVVVPPGDASVDGVAPANDGSSDASTDAPKDSAGDEPPEYREDGGPTPGEIDCRTVTCTTGKCCYNADTNEGACAPTGSECVVGGGVIPIACDDDSDCPIGRRFCCRGKTTGFITCEDYCPAEERVCHAGTSVCSGAPCLPEIDGYFGVCQ